MKNYYFQADSVWLIPSGYGLLYNHSDQPNTSYYYDATRHQLLFKALRKIHPGEEILINYGKTWFSDRKIPIKKLAGWQRWLRFSIGVPLRTSLIIVALLLINQWLHVLAAK